MKYCRNCGSPLSSEKISGISGISGITPTPSITCPNCGIHLLNTPYNPAVQLFPDSSTETLRLNRASMSKHNSATVADSGGSIGGSASSPSTSHKEGTDYGIQEHPQTLQTLQHRSALYSASSRTTPYTPPVQFQPTPSLPQPHPPTQVNSGLSKGMMSLLLLLALLMMFAGASLIFYTTLAHPAQLRAQATATVQTILTTNARSTVVANAQATGTAVTHANAASTAQAQATAQTIATTTALQSLYARATSGTPTLTSSLASPDSYNWDTYNTSDGGGCAFTSGALHSSVFLPHYYVPCYARATNFSNFAYQVQMTINKGDEGGLIFRADSTNARFYFFRIGTDGNYSLSISKDNNSNLAIAFDNSSAIKTTLGQPNLLTVIAQGSTIYLYINRQYVGSANDGSYSAGSIGIFAGDNTNGTDVAFSNAEVWSL